jgi:hypothetical protein
LADNGINHALARILNFICYVLHLVSNARKPKKKKRLSIQINKHPQSFGKRTHNSAFDVYRKIPKYCNQLTEAQQTFVEQKANMRPTINQPASQPINQKKSLEGPIQLTHKRQVKTRIPTPVKSMNINLTHKVALF